MYLGLEIKWIVSLTSKELGPFLMQTSSKVRKNMKMERDSRQF